MLSEGQSPKGGCGDYTIADRVGNRNYSLFIKSLFITKRFTYVLNPVNQIDNGIDNRIKREEKHLIHRCEKGGHRR